MVNISRPFPLPTNSNKSQHQQIDKIRSALHALLGNRKHWGVVASTTMLFQAHQSQSMLLRNKSHGQNTRCVLALKENYIRVQPAQFMGLWGKPTCNAVKCIDLWCLRRGHGGELSSSWILHRHLPAGRNEKWRGLHHSKNKWGQWRKAELLCSICQSGSNRWLKCSFSSLVWLVIKRCQDDGCRDGACLKSETQTQVPPASPSFSCLPFAW